MASRPPPGTKVLIGPLLGEGGFASVREALDEREGLRFAWKEMREVFRGDGGHAARVRAAFAVEAWIMSRIRHPGVPEIFGFWDDRRGFLMERLFAVQMDRISGTGWIDRTPAAIRLRLALDLIETVSAVHSAGFLHLDIKHSNLLLGPSGQLYLIDFGVSALEWLRRKVGADWALPVSQEYAAPEVIANEDPRLDERSDVYSLAVAVYRLMSGRLPYRLRPGSGQELVEQIQEVDPRPVTDFDPSLPTAVDAVLARGLSFDPRERPANAAAFLRELRGVAGSLFPADSTDLEQWANGFFQDGNQPISPWTGVDPEGTLVVDESKHEPRPPRIPGSIHRLDIRPEALLKPGDVMVSWAVEGDADDFNIHLFRQGDMRGTEESSKSATTVLEVKNRGEYAIRVRAVVDGLAGPWSEQAKIRVGGGVSAVPWKAAAFGVLALVGVTAVIVGLVVMSGRTGTMKIRNSGGSRLVILKDGVEVAGRSVPKDENTAIFDRLPYGNYVIRLEGDGARPSVLRPAFRRDGQEFTLALGPPAVELPTPEPFAVAQEKEQAAPPVPQVGTLVVRTRGGDRLELRNGQGNVLRSRAVPAHGATTSFDALSLNTSYRVVLRSSSGIEDRRDVFLSHVWTTVDLSIVDSGRLKIRTHGGTRLEITVGSWTKSVSLKPDDGLVVVPDVPFGRCSVVLYPKTGAAAIEKEFSFDDDGQQIVVEVAESSGWGGWGSSPEPSPTPTATPSPTPTATPVLGSFLAGGGPATVAPTPSPTPPPGSSLAGPALCNESGRIKILVKGGRHLLEIGGSGVGLGENSSNYKIDAGRLQEGANHFRIDTTGEEVFKISSEQVGQLNAGLSVALTGNGGTKMKLKCAN